MGRGCQACLIIQTSVCGTQQQHPQSKPLLLDLNFNWASAGANDFLVNSIHIGHISTVLEGKAPHPPHLMMQEGIRAEGLSLVSTACGSVECRRHDEDVSDHYIAESDLK